MPAVQALFLAVGLPEQHALAQLRAAEDAAGGAAALADVVAAGVEHLAARVADAVGGFDRSVRVMHWGSPAGRPGPARRPAAPAWSRHGRDWHPGPDGQRCLAPPRRA